MNHNPSLEALITAAGMATADSFTYEPDANQQVRVDLTHRFNHARTLFNQTTDTFQNTIKQTITTQYHKHIEPIGQWFLQQHDLFKNMRLNINALVQRLSPAKAT